MSDRWKQFLPDTGPKIDQRSDIIRATGAAGGQTLCFCPYVQQLPKDEQDAHIDENGFCEHYIGDTVPGNDRMYFPFKPAVFKSGENKSVRMKDGSTKLPVQTTDHLERVQVVSRVYREFPLEPAAENEPAKTSKQESRGKKELAAV